jgi:hypothetical protein
MPEYNSKNAKGRAGKKNNAIVVAMAQAEQVFDVVIASGLVGPEDVRVLSRPLCEVWDLQARAIVLAPACPWSFLSSAARALLQGGVVGCRLLGHRPFGCCGDEGGASGRVARLIARGRCVRALAARRMTSASEAAEVLLAIEAGERLATLDLGGGSAHALLGGSATRDRASAALAALSALRELVVGGVAATSWMSGDTCYDVSIALTVPRWLGGLASLEVLDARGFGWARTSAALAAALRDGALTCLRTLRLTYHARAPAASSPPTAFGGPDALAAALAGPHLAPTLRELVLVLALPPPPPSPARPRPRPSAISSRNLEPSAHTCGTEAEGGEDRVERGDVRVGG